MERKEKNKMTFVQGMFVYLTYFSSGLFIVSIIGLALAGVFGW